MWSRVVAVLVSLLAVLTPSSGHAVFHIAHISELMSGAGGDPSIEYVEIRMEADTQNSVGNTRLTTFSCDGSTVTVILLVPGAVPNSGNGLHWIMASPSAAAFLAASGISPDFTWDSTTPGNAIPTPCGQVCWGAPGIAPPDPTTWSASDPNQYVDCVAYGGYTGPTKTADPDNDFVTSSDGTPTTLPPGDGTLSLTRMTNTNNNVADFALACPTPTNNNGGMGNFGPCTPPSTTTTTATTTTTTTTTAPPNKSKCTSKEFTAAGKKAGAKAKCHAKATSKGDPSTLGTCLGAAEMKFTAAYAKATAAGDCLTTADATTVENEVNDFISSLTQTLTNGSTQASKCTSKEFVAAGKKAGGKAKCYAKAAKKNDTSGLSSCLGGAETKFTTAYGKATTAAGGCLTGADANTVEGEVNSFISSLKNSLAPGLP